MSFTFGGNLPVHVGLGRVDKVDLRVVFPGARTVELKGVPVNGTVDAVCP